MYLLRNRAVELLIAKSRSGVACIRSQPTQFLILIVKPLLDGSKLLTLKLEYLFLYYWKQINITVLFLQVFVSSVYFVNSVIIQTLTKHVNSFLVSIYLY